ncbi:MAG: ABC transporter ATP-binding protein [Deltaproteobacteria bacterium]|nr:ABC transporter ATP-binding protein [Deltaproteobacteria bacterium]
MLEARQVSLRYDGVIQAVDGVDFTVAPGGLVALLGPNGAGKSTLLKAVAGMLPFEQGEVAAGSISFDGRSLLGMHPASIARLGIALVQEGRQCFRGLSIAENLKAASLARPRGAATRLDMVFDYFPFLREMRQRPAGHLSGGQLQMLVIGMAMMGQPRLLLLDEPSLGLSPTMVQTVFDVVERMHHELSVTVVVAEQTVPRLLKMATDVYVLSRGRVVMHTPPAQADEETLQRVYLS